MQILMTKAAYGRVGDRLATIAPDAEVVTAVSARRLRARTASRSTRTPSIPRSSGSAWTATLGGLMGAAVRPDS